MAFYENTIVVRQDLAEKEVKDLKKSYLVPGHKKKTFNAVDRISLKIRKGEIYGILGPKPKFHNSNDPAGNPSPDWPVCMRTIDYHVNPSNKNHSYRLNQTQNRLHRSETTSCRQQTTVQVHELALFHSAGYLNQSY